jgi:hypothetical protein
MYKSQEIQLIYEGIHNCTVCHGNPGGTIKPDPQKIVRKFFPTSMVKEKRISTAKPSV